MPMRLGSTTRTLLFIKLRADVADASKSRAAETGIASAIGAGAATGYGLGWSGRYDRGDDRYGDNRRKSEGPHHLTTVHPDQGWRRSRSSRKQVIALELIEGQPDDTFVHVGA